MAKKNVRDDPSKTQVTENMHIDRCHIGVCPLFEIHSDIHNSGI